MNEYETYIISRIQSGVTPLDALAEIIYHNNENFRIHYDPNDTEMGKFNLIIGDPYFELMKLSFPFLTQWILYPSGLPRSSMKYANINKTINLKDKFITLTTHPQILNYNELIRKLGPFGDTSKSVLYNGVQDPNGTIYQSYVLLVETPMYIPVVRYAIKSGGGFLFGGIQITNGKEFCGTYYWLEPDSDIYLLSNKTLVVPNDDVGLYVLLGGTKENFITAIDKYYYYYGRDDPYLARENLTNKILSNYNRAAKGQLPLDEPRLDELEYEIKLDIEQEMCKLANNMGIDTIILFGQETHKFGFASEIIDTRARKQSYDSLYLNQ